MRPCTPCYECGAAEGIFDERVDARGQVGLCDGQVGFRDRGEDGAGGVEAGGVEEDCEEAGDEVECCDDEDVVELAV